MGIGALGTPALLPGSRRRSIWAGCEGMIESFAVEVFWDAYKTRQKGQNWGSPGHEEFPCPMVGQGIGIRAGKEVPRPLSVNPPVVRSHRPCYPFWPRVKQGRCGDFG